MQKELLISLPDIVMSIKITERDFSDILDAAIPLLNKNASPLLQQLCVDFVLKFTEYNEPAVYVKLNDLNNLPDYTENVSKIIFTGIA